MKIITRTVVILSVVSLFTDIASEMLYPVIPVYLQSIGFSVLFIGILEGIAEAVAGLSKGYFGRMSDLTGRRVPFVRIGYALSAVSKPMMALMIYPLWIFFARTLDRLGKGVRTAARDAMLSDETTPEHKGKVFGFHRAADTLGAAFGPVIALIFLWIYPGHYQIIFFLAVIPGIFSVGSTFLLREKSRPAVEKKGQSFFAYFRYWKSAASSYRILVTGLLLFSLMNSSDAFLLLMMKHQGLSDVWMIGLYIFYNLIYAVLSYPMGFIGDKIGLKNMLFIGMALFIIVYTGMALVTGIHLLFALFFIYGAYAAGTEGVSKALISNLCAKDQTATAIGFYTSFSSIGAMLASMIGGVIWFTFSPQAMFIVSAAGTGIALLFLLVFLKTPHERQPE
jgi:MFS family permease